MTTTLQTSPTPNSRQTSVPLANEMILAAQNARSFQTRELLQRIVMGVDSRQQLTA